MGIKNKFGQYVTYSLEDNYMQILFTRVTI